MKTETAAQLIEAIDYGGSFFAEYLEKSLYCDMVYLCIGRFAGHGMEGGSICVKLRLIMLVQIRGICICFVVNDMPGTVFSVDYIHDTIRDLQENIPL